MKKLILASLITALTAGCLNANAAFAKTNNYTEGQFTDVPANEWYSDSVKNAYEFGIMNGDSATTFTPAGTLTVAEGITISARIHATINEKTIPDVTGGEWYQKYVDYAVTEGIMTADFFNSYDRNITRSEIAVLFANVSGNLTNINSVTKLPDVPVDASYTDEVLKLYNGGILTGNDANGTFNPSSNLLRSEISAMAVRIADESKRVAKQFPEIKSLNYSDAYYLIEAIGITGKANGWDVDNRFQYYNTTASATNNASDVNDTTFSRLIRDFDAEESGILRFEAVVNASSKNGGVYIAFENENEERVIELCEKNGKWVLCGETEAVSDIAVPTDISEKFAVVMDIDLTNGKVSALINNKPISEISIKDSSVQRLVIGTNKVGTGSITFTHARLAKNYPVLEHFVVTEKEIGQKPFGWDITGNFAIAKTEGVFGDDIYSLKGTNGTALKSFDAVSGEICLESTILLPEKEDGAVYSVLSGGNTVLKIETKNGKLVCGDVELNDYLPNVWQNIRIETNPYTRTAKIRINGKDKGLFPFNADFIDGVKLDFVSDGSEIWFDDIEISNINHHADYPETPKVAESTDYNIGINMCYLWRDTQSGEGWDAVSPFEEFDTYYGFYDEGLKETADWELKWMAEHGIDFMHVCWYSPMPNLNAPPKKMRISHGALHDGYMNADYSDLVKFCIMWENSDKFGGARTLEDFKKYLWPFWVEYYFKDERYATLDNKAILSVWNSSEFKKSMGGDEGTKEAFKFMEEELKKLGYDGIEIIDNVSSGSTVETYQAFEKFGNASSYAYAWGAAGYSADYQISAIKNNIAAASQTTSHHIPTVSIGYNGAARYKTRAPLITPEGHLQVCEYIKEVLSEMNTGTWRDNTLIISTWNEYSEGTYISPTSSTGYAYLENVRKAFTNDTSDHSSLDTTLTKAQIDRIGHLYPPAHSPITRLLLETSDNEKQSTDVSSMIPVEGYSWDMSTEEGTNGWEHQFNILDYKEENGVISGTGKTGDYAIKTSNFKPIDSAEIPYIHLRMKIDTLADMEIFFITEQDTTWNSTKKAHYRHTVVGEYTDIYINMAKINAYSGKVKAIRIDPLTTVGSFEISLIEFLATPKADTSNIPVVNVNGFTYDFEFEPTLTADADVLVTAQAGFFTGMRVYYEFDRFTDGGQLRIFTRDDKKIVFTVGSNKVKINGEEKDAGFTLTMRDGLPTFELKKLCDILGYEYTVEGNIYKVNATDSKEEYNKIVEANSGYSWTFDYGEKEGWAGQNGSLVVENGYLVITPSTGDSAVTHKVSFDSEEYTHLVFGVKNTEATKNWTAQLFFTTKYSTSFAADKKVNGKYQTEGKNIGETVECWIPLYTSEGYRDEITALRLDQHMTKDVVHFDYIKLVKDEERMAIEKEVAEKEAAEKEEAHLASLPKIVTPIPGETPPNGITVYAGGTNCTELSVGINPENPNEKVYELKNIKPGQYTYFNIGMEFIPGATYKISYKVYPLLDTEGNKFSATFIAPNFRYGTDGKATKDHTFGMGKKIASGDGWKEVTAESTISADYVPSGKDFFQIWGAPSGGMSINYLVKDVVIELVKMPVKETEPEKPAEPLKLVAPKPGETLEKGISVYAGGTNCTELTVGVDPENSAVKVYELKCTREGQYTYLNVGMELMAGTTYKVSYKVYPLKNMNGENYGATYIAPNFRYGTDGNSTVNHTFAQITKFASGDGWKEVTAEYTVAEDYKSSGKDYFQIWGQPVNGVGINYLIKDLVIEVKE